MIPAVQRATRWNGTARVLVVTVARRRGCMLGAPVLRSAVRDGRGPQRRGPGRLQARRPQASPLFRLVRITSARFTTRMTSALPRRTGTGARWCARWPTSSSRAACSTTASRASGVTRARTSICSPSRARSLLLPELPRQRLALWTLWLEDSLLVAACRTARWCSRSPSASARGVSTADAPRRSRPRRRAHRYRSRPGAHRRARARGRVSWPRFRPTARSRTGIRTFI